MAKKTTSLNLNEETLEELDKIAAEEKRSRSNMVEIIISNWLSYRKKKDKGSKRSGGGDSGKSE